MRTAMSDQYVLCMYVRADEALPDTSAGRIPVRAQIVMQAAGRKGDPRGGTRYGPQTGGGGGHGLSRGEMGTRGMRIASVAMGMLPPGASIAGVAFGVVDPADGLNGRIVKLIDGDKLVCPASALFGPQGASESDLVITLKGISTDGTCWMAEGTL